MFSFYFNRAAISFSLRNALLFQSNINTSIWYLVYYSARLLTPNFARMSSMRHHLVKADCSRLSPTKAVKRCQYLLYKYPNTSDTRIKIPAMARIHCSIFMTFTLVFSNFIDTICFCGLFYPFESCMARKVKPPVYQCLE